MAQRKITISLEITVRDYTKAERDEESLEKEECEGAADAVDADELAEAIASHIQEEQDEVLAGSGELVKVKAVTAKVIE